MRLSKTALIFFHLFAFFISFSQTLIFEKYTAKDGLLSDNTYNLHQDKQGYIWVFTNYGALKYNGSEFIPVLKNLSIKESFIYCMYENKHGQKWIANSNAKIFEVKNDSAFVVKGTEEITDYFRKGAQEIFQMYTDDKLDIYVITMRKSFVCKRQPDGTYVTEALKVKTKNKNIVYQIWKKEKTLLPIINFEMFIKPLKAMKDILYFKHHKTFLIELLIGKDRSVLEIVSTGNGSRHFKQFGEDIYIGSFDNLVKIRNGKVNYIPVNAVVTNFTKDKNNHTWIACFNNGIVELNEKDSIINRYLPGISINYILFDSEGGLWASSAESGLYHCKNLNAFSFKETEPLGSSVQLMKIIDSNLFLINLKGELYRIRHNTIHRVIQFDPSEPLLDITRMDSTYIFSYQQKIQEVKIPKQGPVQVIHTNKMIGNSLKIIALNHKNLLYVNRNYVGYLDNITLKKAIPVNEKIFTFELRDEKIFIATANGVYVLEKKRLQTIVNTSGLLFEGSIVLDLPSYLAPVKNSLVKKIVTDIHKTLWFCSTGNGVFKLDTKNKLSHFSVREGLPSDVINDISFKDDSNVLLSSNKGLYLATKEKNDLSNLTWKNIYPEEVHYALFFGDKIFAGTKNGLIILDYKKTNSSEHIYFNLRSLHSNSKEINLKVLKKLNYNQNNLEFKFDLILLSGIKSHIYYKLNGAVNDSGLVNEDRLTLLNLPNGHYDLTVFPAIDKNKNLNFQFKIIPAFWQTKLFLIASFLLFLLIAFFITKKLVSNYKRKEIKKLEAEALILEYKLTALKAQINPHFMSNCLSSIQNLIYSGDVEKGGEYLANFSVFFRQILDYSGRHYLSLEKELEVIILYIELEQLRFKNGFTKYIIIDPSINTSEIQIPSLITQPFIENAIWHGLLPLKQRVPQLSIRIYPSNANLFIEIEDNGIGRSLEPALHKISKGTQLSMDKIESINQLRNRTDFVLRIEDLFDETGLPRGTKVIIQLTNYISEDDS